MGSKDRRIDSAHPARGAYGLNSNYADYIVIAGSPTWTVRAHGEVSTDPRPIPLGAHELRYGDGFTSEAVVIVDGVRRGDLDATFEVSFEPARDWEPPSAHSRDPSAAIAGRHAAVGFAFGVRDVYSKTQPLSSMELVVTDSAVQLTERQDAFLGNEDPKVRVIAQQPADFRGHKQLTVAIHIAGATATATGGGRSFTFAIPAEHTGFYGFSFRAPGYAAVRSWKIGAAR